MIDCSYSHSELPGTVGSSSKTTASASASAMATGAAMVEVVRANKITVMYVVKSMAKGRLVRVDKLTG